MKPPDLGSARSDWADRPDRPVRVFPFAFQPWNLGTSEVSKVSVLLAKLILGPHLGRSSKIQCPFMEILVILSRQCSTGSTTLTPFASSLSCPSLCAINVPGSLIPT